MKLNVSNIALLMLSSSLLAGPSSGCGGTEAGNPTASSPDSNAIPPANMQALVSNRVLVVICERLTSCYASLSTDQCRSGILATTNLAPAFGAPLSYSTFQTLVDGEASGALTASTQPSVQCQADIQALTCGEISSLSAFSSLDMSDFTHIVNLVPVGVSSCGGIY